MKNRVWFNPNAQPPMIQPFKCQDCRSYIFMTFNDLWKICNYTQYCPECMLKRRHPKFVEAGIEFYQKMVKREAISVIEYKIKLFCIEKLEEYEKLKQELNKQ